MDKEYITASELSDYVYCQRSWWLKMQGFLAPNEKMATGQIQHTRLAEWLRVIKRYIIIAILLIITGIILGIVAVMLFR